MKRLIWVFAALLVAMPVFAQDEGGGGLPSSLFGGGDFGGGRDQPKPMDAVKKFFAGANVTINSDQEKTLKPMIEAAFKQVQDTVERLTPQPAAGDRGGRGGQGGQGGQAGQGGQGGNRRGGGGGGADGGQRRGGRGGQGGGTDVAANPQLVAELQKINDDVLGKIVATFTPDQKAGFKKWQNDQIKKAGGYAALRITMEEAGAPLTAEQEPQVRALYVEDTQQRSQLQREAQGRPDKAKIDELERTTLGKVVKVLTAAQRKALLDSSKPKP